MQPTTVNIQGPTGLDSSLLAPAENEDRPKPCYVTYGTVVAWQGYLAVFALLLIPVGCMVYDKLGNVPCEGAPSIYAGCRDTKGHCKHHHFLNYRDDPVAFGCDDTTCSAFQDCHSTNKSSGCPVPCSDWPPSTNASAAERQRLGEKCVRKGFGRWVSDEANCTEPRVQQCAPISKDWSAVSVPSFGGECQTIDDLECLCRGPYWSTIGDLMAYIIIWLIVACYCCVRDLTRTCHPRLRNEGCWGKVAFSALGCTLAWLAFIAVGMGVTMVVWLVTPTEAL